MIDRRTCVRASVVAVCAMALWTPSTALADTVPSFQGLGDLPGGAFRSDAYGISADGSTVVGCGQVLPVSGADQAFRWTSSGGMVGIGDPPYGSGSYSRAYGVSADGSVVVGTDYRFDAAGDNHQRGFRWTEADGMVYLNDEGYDDATGVSADGSVVVGTNWNYRDPEDPYDQRRMPFRWTADGGAVNLGTVQGYTSGYAMGVSADGSNIVGKCLNLGYSGSTAVLWSDTYGITFNLGDLPGGEYRSEARGISADGSTVVGFGTSASGSEAFRWTMDGVMVGLGDLPGGVFYSSATAASADGSIIFGASQSDAGTEAFIWTAEAGMCSLQDMLSTDYGLDLTGWRLGHVAGISDDGGTLAGWGWNPDGKHEAWVATIPEPTALSLLALGGLFVVRRRRRD